MAGLVDIAGMRWAVRDPFAKPSPKELTETSFKWIEGLPRESVVGVLDDEANRPLDAVGCFLWERKSEKGDSVEQLAEGFVGIYAHGGSYLHFSAHESSATSGEPIILTT